MPAPANFNGVRPVIAPDDAPWRIHDIRRTVATGIQALQDRTEIIEAVLNHLAGTKSGIVGVYQCYSYQEEKRQAMKRHIKKLTAA